MFCSECGNEIKEGAKFCPMCGTPVFVPPVQEVVEETAEQVQDTVVEAVEQAEEKITEAAEQVQEVVADAAEPEIAPPGEERPAEAAVVHEAPKTAPEVRSEPVKAAAQAVLGNAVAAAKGIKLSNLDTAAMVLAAISVICMFISLTKGAVVSRIFHIIAAGMLTFLCARKEKYPSLLHAIPVCIVALVNIFNSARLIILSITNKYVRYRPEVISSLYKILLIAAFVLLLLLGVKAVSNRKSVNRIVLVISALLAVYHIFNLFRNIRNGRAVIFINLAMLLFYAAYIVMCILYEKTAKDEPEAEPLAGAEAKPFKGNYTYSGTRQAASETAADSAPLFGPKKVSAKDPEPLFRTESECAPDPNFVFCVNCGAKLPADSAFCNKCGSPVLK